MQLASDQRIGVYTILSPLGEGGMGQVYRARDPRLQRDVALKILPGHVASDPQARARFEQEARLASSLNHPNIVVIHDIGESDGVPFIAMELVEGETLAARLRGGPMPVPAALDAAAQLAEGLARAHEAGVVHRDLKPGNIMLTPDGRVKILDFGIGKAVDDARSDAATRLEPQTRPGDVIGTAAYMSPEQARGRCVDYRSDQFSFGLVVHEMITGRHPFARPSALQVMSAIVGDEPTAMIAARPDVPDAAALLIERCLAKTPESRFDSTGDLARALRDVEDSVRTGRRVARIAGDAPHTLRRWLAAPAAFVLVAGGAVGWNGSQPSPAPEPATRQIAVLPFANVGGGPETQALSDGLVEVLTTRLTQMERFAGDLLVVPASEVRHQQIASAQDARRAFGVSLVISGSVQRAAGRLRLTLNLVDPASLRQLRTDTLDLAMTDPSALQDEVLRRLAQLLDLEVGGDVQAVVAAGGTRAPGAYEYYLQGRGYLQRYEKVENLTLALSLFERAVAADPAYAMAHAAVAETAVRMHEATRDGAWLRRARASADKALALAPALAAVRVTAAMIATETGRYEDAVKMLVEVIALDRTNAAAYRELGRAYEALGDPGRAEATLKDAVTARPNDWSTYNHLGGFYFRRHDYPAAAEQFERVVALTPDNGRGYSNLGGVYAQMGRLDRALPALERATALNPTAAAWSNLGTVYFMQSRHESAARAFEEAVARGAKNYQVWFNLGSAYEWVPGSEQKIVAALAKAAELGERERSVNPRQPMLLARLAACYARLDQKDRSRQLIGEAERLAPTDARVLLLAAQVHERLGDRATALARVAAAVESGLPRSEIENNRSLAELRKDPAYSNTVH